MHGSVTMKRLRNAISDIYIYIYIYIYNVYTWYTSYIRYIYNDYIRGWYVMVREKIIEVSSPRDATLPCISARRSLEAAHSLHVDNQKLTVCKQCLIINKFVNEDVT